MSNTVEVLNDQTVEKWESDVQIFSLALLMTCFAD